MAELNEAAKQALRIASCLENLPNIELNFGVLKVNTHELAKLSSENKEPTINIPKLKKQISKSITNSKKRLVIFLDDIDRLSASEICDLFRVIKALCDFPNVTYVLAFDRDVVASALENFQQTPGLTYLEKIIQVPFELPIADAVGLAQMTNVYLERIYGTEGIDFTYFGIMYASGIQQLLETPRDIVRVMNSLTITFPSLRGEVNPADFFAIEVLRVRCPQLYDRIRFNPSQFAGHYETGRPFEEELKAFHDETLKLIDTLKAPCAKPLLIKLFPKLEGVWKYTKYGANYAKEWRTQNRICSDEKIDVYFRFSVPTSMISNAEIAALLKASSNKQLFDQLILTYPGQKLSTGRSRTNSILQRLYQSAPTDVPEKFIQTVINSLAANVELLAPAGDDSPNLFETNNLLLIALTILVLLERLPINDRFEALLLCISELTSPPVVIFLARLIGQEHGKHGSSIHSANPSISLPELERFEKLSFQLLASDIVHGKQRSLHSRFLAEALNNCKEFACKANLDEVVRAIVITPEGFTALLKSCMYPWDLSGDLEQLKFRFDTGKIQSIADREAFVERARKLREGLPKHNLNEEQMKILEVFLKKEEFLSSLTKSQPAK